MQIRSLEKGDEEKLEQYLKQHAEYFMFLRSNLKHSDLVYHDSPFHGEYFASTVSKKNFSPNHGYFRTQRASEQAKSVIDFLNIQPDKFAINRAETLYSIHISKLKSYSPKNQKFDIVDANKVNSTTLF